MLLHPGATIYTEQVCSVTAQRTAIYAEREKYVVSLQLYCVKSSTSVQLQCRDSAMNVMLHPFPSLQTKQHYILQREETLLLTYKLKMEFSKEHIFKERRLYVLRKQWRF